MAEDEAAATGPEQKAHVVFALDQSRRFEENPKEWNVTQPLETPPGAPVGGELPGW